MSSVVIKSIDEKFVRRRVEEYAQSLFESHPEVEEIIVFGSFESGTWGPGSDLDLFLVLSRSERTIRDRIPDYLPARFPVSVDLFPYTRAEIETLSPSPILDAVRRSRWRYSRQTESASERTSASPLESDS